MITFLDERDVEHGALATIKVTNAVNGERSLTGEIESGDYVLANIERGWRLRFEDEFYVVTYAKPVDDGKATHVTFDAIHQFFWDFDKSSVHEQLNDGSHTVLNYLDFIFADSGYTYTIDPLLKVYAFEKQSFGYKSRLNLFNDIITASGVEFQVNGKVVRILEKTGTDLSTVVRKNFNMNELGIEKHIGDFVTYQKGFGAWVDENDHTKGRLVTEYTSPLASVYGKLEAEPLVDERYTQADNMIAALKANVDNSYSLSIRLDMEDLTRAGYEYTQPRAGDYIMAINETLDFQEKIRIVSFTSEYDVSGQLVKHEVTCNDIGVVKKLSASYNLTKEQAKNASDSVGKAVEMANKALVSADGKSTVYFGNEFPKDEPKGTLHKGDSLYLTVGDTTKMYYWTGADWEELPIVNDVEAFKEQIAEELKDVPNREEFENKIAEELANSKAEIETQIETAKTQAESNAKEYADTINEETAKVAELANAAADEIKADLVNVKNNLTATSLVANNAQAAVDEAKQDLTEVASELNTAKQDLANSVTEVNTKVDSAKAELTQAKQDLQAQASQLTAQANAQSELTNRVSSVEETANGTKTTVSELSKTVAQNGKDITSVTARTKVVEDDLTSTKTTLSQVQTTADGANQKTATLETGLNGLTAKFENLSVGNKNYLPASRVVNRGATDFSYDSTNKKWTMSIPANRYTWGKGIYFNTDNLNIALNGGETLFFGMMIKANKTCSFIFDINNYLSGSYSNDNDERSKAAWYPTNKTIPANTWTRVWFSYTAKDNVPIRDSNSNFGITGNTETVDIELKEVIIAKSNVPVDYQEADADIEQKVAEYKQTADQNYASLQTTVQNLDGTVQHNKTVADQTAEGFKTRIESLETYKDGETTRASQYFESAKTETARQLTAERTAIAKDYVAKSTYTSDVTGIRNDLTATTTTANTTKQNLASYQASNDKAVANLQSNLQTANGNISSLQTKIEAVPGQITSAVSAVEGKIPTNVSTRNLILKSNDFANPHKQNGANTTVTSTDDYFVIKSTGYTANAWGGMSWNMSISEVKGGEEFSILMPVYIDSSVDLDNDWAFTIKNHPSNSAAYSYDIPTNKKDQWFNVAITFKASKDVVFDTYPFYVFLVKNGLVRIKPPMLVRGNLIPSDYQPAFEDYDSKLATAQSEIKQTTDAISASVSALDNSTVKNASLTINTDGIVMKAGKSTTDVANAIGSYFAVNQNAINLFSDKINVKGSMIVDGAITSTKIASKTIDTAHLNGKIITADVISSNAITADAIKAGAVTTSAMSANSINGDRITAGTLDAAKIKAGSITASQIASGTITSAQIETGTISAGNIATGTITGDNIKANSVDVSKISGLSAEYLKAKIENAMIDWMKGKTITAYNGNMAIDLQNGRINFKDGSNAVYRQTDDGIHTGFLHFEAGSQGGIYAAFGATSTRQGINSKSSEFAGIRCYRVSAYGDSHDAKIDKIEVIGDAIQFGHGYRSDGQIGGGFIMDTAVFGNDTPYSLNRVIKSIEALWRILHDHAKNTGYRFNDSAFIGALNNEYNVWHDMHNI